MKSNPNFGGRVILALAATMVGAALFAVMRALGFPLSVLVAEIIVVPAVIFSFAEF